MKLRLWGLLLPFTLALTLTAQTAEIPVTDDNFAQVTNLGAVNTPYSEYTPFITSDEHYLFFQSNRPGGVATAGDFDLWYTENENTEGAPKFKPPGNVGLPVNSGDFDGHPTLRKLPSGEFEMYFSSFAEDGRQGPQLTNIYYTIFRDNKWQQAIPVIEVNTDFQDRMPSLSQDGHYLFFSSDRPGGFGKDDIWFSEYDFAAKRWGKPKNAGRTINTPSAEVTPAIHSDNITLYFSSDRSGGVGGYDIYVTQMLQSMPTAGMSGGDTESMWKKPMNLGKPYNSVSDDEYPTVIRSGSHMYFASNREGGQGAFDIYRARVPEFAKPEIVVTLKGRVKEKFSDKGIEANIKISDLDGERNFSTTLPEGLYSANLINKKQYKMTITAPGYEAIEYIADLRDVHTPVTIQKDFEMERKIALPKEIRIMVSFVDDKNKLLKPNALYRLIPDNADDRVLALKKNGAAEITVPAMAKFKKAEDALAALDAMRLTIKATLKNYEDLVDEKSLGQLIRGTNGELKDVVELKLTMREKDYVVEKKCDKGSNCIGIAYFSTNVANRMTNEKDSGLAYVVDLWNKQPHKTIYLHGHADIRGPKGHNMKLSKARAEFIKRKLVKLGIPAEMIVTKGYGSSEPADTNQKSEDGRKKNRRVELFLGEGKPGEKIAEVPAADLKPEIKSEAKPEKKPAVKKPAKKKKNLKPEIVQPTKKETVKPSPKAETTSEKPAVDGEDTTESTSEPAKPATDTTKPAKPGKPPETELKIK